MGWVQALYPVLTAPDPLMGLLGLCSRSFLLGWYYGNDPQERFNSSILSVPGDVSPGWRELCTAQQLAMLMLAAAEAPLILQTHPSCPQPLSCD